MHIPLRPLGRIKTLVDAISLDVSYAFDDLVFIEHNAFLLQMNEENGENLAVWFNTDSNPEDRPIILSQLQAQGKMLSLTIHQKGTYSLIGKDDAESFQLKFMSA